MSRKRRTLLAAMTVMGGAIGGAGVDLLLSVREAQANGRSKSGRVIVAEKMFLCDKAGNLRLALSVSDKTGGTLVLYDTSGRERVIVSADVGDQGPAVVLKDGAGKMRVVLTENLANKGPGVRLFDKNGQPDPSWAAAN